jgi:AcrR family transcriptional regulator
VAQSLTGRKDVSEPAAPNGDRTPPPGRQKIEKALRSLLENKEFSAITTSEIAKTAGVTEALIYKYFKDKRDLLYQVLARDLEHHLELAQLHLKGINGARNKIRKLIWFYLNAYAEERVFGQMLMLEVLSFHDFYQSAPFQVLKKFASLELGILKEGIETGEIRADLPPALIRQVIRGSIENTCLAWVKISQKISPDELTENLCRLLFKGIEKP